MEIGKRVKNLRESKGIKATVLAKNSFISQPYLSDIEKGKTTPSIETLKSICEALEISLSDFFGEISELPPEAIKLINHTKKLTTDEMKTLEAFIETIVRKR